MRRCRPPSSIQCPCMSSLSLMSTNSIVCPTLRHRLCWLNFHGSGRGGIQNAKRISVPAARRLASIGFDSPPGLMATLRLKKNTSVLYQPAVKQLLAHCNPQHTGERVREAKRVRVHQVICLRRQVNFLSEMICKCRRRKENVAVVSFSFCFFFSEAALG